MRISAINDNDKLLRVSEATQIATSPDEKTIVFRANNVNI